MEPSTESAAQPVPSGGKGAEHRDAPRMSHPWSASAETRRLTVVPGTPPSASPVSEREAVVIGTDLGLLAPLVSCLRSNGIRALLTMSPDQAMRLTERWSPHAALVFDETVGTARLLQHLDRRGVSTVLVAAPESL